MPEPEIHQVDYWKSLEGATPIQVQDLIQDKIVDYQAQIEQLQNNIRNLRAIRNSFAALHVKMPTEILMHIFRQVNPTSMREIRLTHVCRTWRTVIHRTPEFWRDFAPTLILEKIRHVQTINEVLARSAPLCFGLEFEERRFLDFLATSPFATRLSSLKVYIYDHLALARLMQLNLPSLESLELRSSGIFQIDPSVISPTMTFSRQFPRLNNLSVDHCPFIPAFTPRSLRHVSLSRMNMAPEKLVKCLEGCPDLQSLALDQCWSNPRTSRTPVDLPQLQSLIISGNSSDTPFLNYITFPQTTHVQLFVKGFGLRVPEPELALPASVSSITSSLGRLVLTTAAETSSQTISLSGYLPSSQPRLMVRLINRRLDLSVNAKQCFSWWDKVGDPTFFSSLPTWLQATEVIRTLELHLHDETLHLTQTTWMELLESFDSVSLLVVDMRSCRKFFKALNLVAVPLSLQELEVVHQDRLNQVDHELIVRAAEHLVDIGSPLQRLAITVQAGVSITSECVPTEWPAASLERLKAVVSEVIFENQE